MKQRVIVSALVEKEGKYLFIKQNKAGGAYPGMLHIPGGGLNVGEDLEQGVRRELREETGIELRDVKPASFAADIFPAYKGEQHQLIFLEFTARYASGTPTASDDAKEIIWLVPSEFSTNPLNPATQNLLLKLGMLGETHHALNP